MSLRRLVDAARSLVVQQDTILGKAVSGGLWLGLSNVAGRSLQFVKLVVLAKVLSPRAFGIFGIALVSVASLKWVSQTGIKRALIYRSEENVDAYLDTAFSISLIRGILLLAVMYFGAPFIADFFSEPRTVPVLRVLAFGPLITGLMNPAAVYFDKDLEFEKKFALNFVGESINVVFAVAYAVTLGTVWAFVVGYLAGKVTTVALSYFLHGYRPVPRFDIDRAKEMVEYGKWITASGPLLFLIGQGDDAFVGWLLGASALGLYRVAYRIGNAPGGEIAEVIMNVSFPVYSQVQEDSDRLRRGYVRTLQLTTAVVVPATCGIVIVARPFVHTFLGTQWLTGILALQILAIYSAVLAVTKINKSLLDAVGRPDLSTKSQFLQLVIIALLIYPLTEQAGIAGTATTILVGTVFARVPHTIASIREVDLPLRRFLRIFAPSLGASGVMVVCVLASLSLVTVSRHALRFGTGVVVGVLTYSAVLLLIARHTDYDLLEFTRRTLADTLSDSG